MRLQAKELEVALYAGLGDARLGGHRAHAPVRLLNAAGNDRLRANDCSCERSSSESSNSGFGLPVLIAVSPFQRYRTGIQD